MEAKQPHGKLWTFRKVGNIEAATPTRCFVETAGESMEIQYRKRCVLSENITSYP